MAMRGETSSFGGPGRQLAGPVGLRDEREKLVHCTGRDISAWGCREMRALRIHACNVEGGGGLTWLG